MAVIRFEIDVPPSTNNLYANVRGKGRVKSRAYSDWLATAGLEAKTQTWGRRLNASWKLSITAHVRTTRDISNLIKPIEDLIVKLGLAPDDRFCRKVEAVRDESVPSGRAVVTIEEAA